MEPTEERREISRRKVLGWMGAGGAALLVADELGGVGLLTKPAGLLGSPPPKGYAPPSTMLLVRAEDGLLLTLAFTNLEVRPRGGKPPQLALKDAGADGLVVIGLPSQSVLEEAVPQTGPALPTFAPPLGAALSGPSRIAVRVPKGSAPIDYDVPGLLQLAGFPLVLNPAADAGNGGAGAKPGPNETAIEAPARLVLSPRPGAVFSATTTPVTRNGRTELWHARAVPRTPAGGAQQRPGSIDVRAIWTSDLEASPPELPPFATVDGRVPLTVKDRKDLVETTMRSDPARADLLLVSPMGASLDITGSWSDDQKITAWRHRATLGRDTYVKVERPGYLFPWGFRATRIEITERVLQDGYAILRRRQLVQVRQPTVVFSEPGHPELLAPGIPFQGRKLPFRRVTTTTLTTPPLAEISQADVQWLRVAGPDGPVDLPFRLELTSQDGTVVRAELPAAFVSDAIAYDSFDVLNDEPFASFNADAGRHTLHLAGQRAGLVPKAPQHPDDPALPVFDVVLRAQDTDLGHDELFAARRLNGYPEMVRADVHVEALDALAPGGAAGLSALAATPPTTPISLFDSYLTSGTNPGAVWARVEQPDPAAALPKVDVPQDVGGGLAAPAFDVAGLSLAHGPVSDVQNMALGTFEPAAYFGEGITLLGGIKLSDLVPKPPPIADPGSGDGLDVPKLTTERTARAVTTRIGWKPTMQEVPLGLFTFTPSKDPDASRLSLEAVFVTNLGGGGVSTRVTGELRRATLDFFGALALPIERLRFESHDGHTPTIDADLGTPAFQGDLQFLNALREYLPSLPGGASVDVSSRGVRAGLTIALPTASVGVVLIQNLSIGLELDLPFNGEQASLALSFCTREHPFHVTVMALGGGGFLGIGMGMRGIQRLEGSLEFGAAVALDFGVASGSLSIMAGIYFKFAQRQDTAGNAVGPTGNTVVITGYVRALGELSVLGLIHASVEFYLGLSFTKEDDPARPGQKLEGKVEGTARLTVRVEVLFFSASVSIELHKEFGAGVDPSFGDQISAGDWSDYCAAFAA